MTILLGNWFVLTITMIVGRACADCLVGDIMYREGDSIGHIGLEYIENSTYDVSAHTCGVNGAIIKEEKIFTCPDIVPYCIQCGERGRDAALCLSEPTAGDRDCGNGKKTEAVVCPDGRDPTSDNFCGRGTNRKDCAKGEFCFIDPTDRFAVCCVESVSSGVTTTFNYYVTCSFIVAFWIFLAFHS